MENFTDSELLKNIERNNHFAFDILLERYWKKLHQTTSARLDDSDATQNIVQEVFIKIWNRRESLDVKTSLENYLHRAVRLSVISHYRSKKATEIQCKRRWKGSIGWKVQFILPQTITNLKILPSHNYLLPASHNVTTSRLIYPIPFAEI
jgi:DNA-directed RNA polymerase specialized sigma24 family protein